MKGVGMLVISLRGVNFRFWSLLGCTGSHLGLKYKKYIFNMFFVCYHLEVKKWPGPCPDWSPLGV